MTGLERFVRRLPKAELHLHLEGAMPASTLLDLARSSGVELPADDEQGLAEWFRFRDFDHFIEVYLLCSRCLDSPEAFVRLVEDVGAALAVQGVVHAEVHVTIGTHAMHGLPVDEVGSALEAGALSVVAAGGPSLGWIYDIVRNVDRRWADLTLEAAIAGRERGVVALGLSGKEDGHPGGPFQRHFEEARRAGLRLVAHAGEHGTAASVREAVEELGAERVGHGVRAASDRSTVRLLAERGVPLEVCPTSNLRLGVVDALAEHPLRELDEAGVEVTINSDDPPLFGTTLVGEYLAVAGALGYGPADLLRFALASVRHAFLPPDRRNAVLDALLETGRRAGEEELGRPILLPSRPASASRPSPTGPRR